MTDSICLRCNHKRYCATGVTQPSENSCITGCSRFEPKPQQTNADKIRAMTDEEMRDWMADHVDCGEDCPAFHRCMIGDIGCADWLMEWLQEEADE